MSPLLLGFPLARLRFLTFGAIRLPPLGLALQFGFRLRDATVGNGLCMVLGRVRLGPIGTVVAPAAPLWRLGPFQELAQVP